MAYVLEDDDLLLARPTLPLVPGILQHELLLYQSLSQRILEKLIHLQGQIHLKIVLNVLVFQL